MSPQLPRFEYNPGAGDVARSPVVYGLLAAGRGLEELVRTFSLISVSSFAPQSRAFVWSLIHVLVALSLAHGLTVLHYFTDCARRSAKSITFMKYTTSFLTQPYRPVHGITYALSSSIALNSLLFIRGDQQL